MLCNLPLRVRHDMVCLGTGRIDGVGMRVVIGFLIAFVVVAMTLPAQAN